MNWQYGKNEEGNKRMNKIKLYVLITTFIAVPAIAFFKDDVQQKFGTGIGNEVCRVGRFIAFDSDVVVDQKTGLMWASEDNGKNISWRAAKRYCENYEGGGYEDWRVPTLDELSSLYGTGPGYPLDCDPAYTIKVNRLIKFTSSCPWAAETNGSKAAFYRIRHGRGDWIRQSFYCGFRALPVRSVN